MITYSINAKMLYVPAISITDNLLSLVSRKQPSKISGLIS